MYSYFTDKYNLKIIYSHQGYGNFIRLYRGIPVELFFMDKDIKSFDDFLPFADTVKSITFWECTLDDLSALSKFKKLKELFIYDGIIQSKRFCQFLQLPSLKEFSISNQNYPEENPYVHSLAEAHLPSLRSLAIGSFETDSLKDVSLPSLRELVFPYSVNSLKGAYIPLLEKLDAEHFKEIDVALPKLKKLHIKLKGFDFSSFKNTPNLRELYAVHTYYDDPQTFDGLEVCKKLKYIEMLSCPFKNFLPFSKLKSLEHLNVSYGSEIESLEGLEQLPNLKKLCLFDNDFIKEIDDISLIKNLKRLEIEKHKVAKIIDEIRKRDIALCIIPDES